MPYMSGQGKVMVADVANGVPGVFRRVFDAAEFTISGDIEIEEVTENESGNRLTALRQQGAKKMNVSFKLRHWTDKNNAMMLYSVPQLIAASTVSNEVFPNPVAVGDFVRLQKPRVSSVVITDSAGSPATLTANTHYRVTSADHGTIEILNLASFVQPLKAAYSFAAHVNTPMFSTGIVERWFRFEGVNTANANEPFLVELYRVSMDPVRNLELINSRTWEGDMQGSALYDETKAADTVLGQFGRVVNLHASIT